VISSTSWQKWTYGTGEELAWEATRGKGASDVQGTLREYAIIVGDLPLLGDFGADET
jgi:hypothetical protein